MTLQLHPKDWGQLNVRVTMTPTTGADGKVSTQVIAHVIAEHPAVKAALETGQTELRHALREAGLHLDRLTVTVQAPAAGVRDQRRRQPPARAAAVKAGAGDSPRRSGRAAQGGSAFGGGHPSPFAAFADGQPGRQYTDTILRLAGTGRWDGNGRHSHFRHGGLEWAGGHPRLGETDVRSVCQFVRHRPQRQCRWHGRASNQSVSQNQFLQLLITELKNQDPTQPTDQTQTLSQLAQFSSLEQMTNLNQTVTQATPTA